MHLRFRKYQGTGNDFVMIDNRDGLVKLTPDQIIHICDRKFGIGSDGVILLQRAEGVDFEMNFYNPDASQSFCGNGSRCVVLFAHDLGLVNNSGTFRAIDGIHEFSLNDDSIAIHMKDIEGISMDGDAYVINTGSPHYISYMRELDQLDILPEARKVRYHEKYKPGGINVNYIEEHGDGIQMRTYERGVEDETLSCGTGVTAAALSFAYRNPGRKSVNVTTRGGSLMVTYTQHDPERFSNIWLSGPAEFVFSGEINL
ncbi:MAG: diaminopimelate epimerase [Flavobacteriales bacterium]|nr:diaminopimelate epimerase [Flavobacteriales bacterium]